MLPCAVGEGARKPIYHSQPSDSQSVAVLCVSISALLLREPEARDQLSAGGRGACQHRAPSGRLRHSTGYGNSAMALLQIFMQDGSLSLCAQSRGCGCLSPRSPLDSCAAQGQHWPQQLCLVMERGRMDLIAYTNKYYLTEAHVR